MNGPGARRPMGDGFVDDEFIWLRDPDLGAELRAWLRAERAIHDRAATRYQGWQERLVDRAAELQGPTAGTPTWTVAGAEYRWRWPDSAEHPLLVRREHGGERVVLDVGALSDTGFVRIGDSAISPLGDRLAYTVDVTGREAYELRLRDLSARTERVLARRAYYGLAWSSDGGSVLSITHDSADRPYQLWRHDAVAARQPVLVHEEQDERFHLSLRTSGDGRTAILRAAARLTAEEWLVDLEDPGAGPRTTGGRSEGRDYLVEPYVDDGVRCLAVCAEDEHGHHAIAVRPLDDDAPPRVVLPAAPRRRPTAVTAVDGALVVSGREDGNAAIWLVDVSGRREVVLVSAPVGSTLEPAAFDSPEGAVCIRTEGLTRPVRWESLDTVTGARAPLLGEPVDRDAGPPLITERVTVEVRDGETVPVTVLRREDVALDGTAPCLLYGYGAWETVIEPDYDPVRLALVESGVVYAHAHVRGGGELGRGWWRGGRMEHKHRTFDDFVDVARFLGETLVDGRRIVARGLSAGGLLMGAAYSRAPELFAGVLAEAPFVDPVTTMSDAGAPLVVVERDEWGDPRREADLAWMLAWSPFDNPPPPDARPRLLVTSAINDPRVSVWEPARWVARLRGTGSMGDDVLFRVDEQARGHWPPPGRWQRVHFQAALLAWVADTMGLPMTPPTTSCTEQAAQA